MLRVNSVIKESIVDGEGLRYVIFVQGCNFHCKGCHNPQTWPMDSKDSKLMSIDDIFIDIKKNPLLDGVTFSGGEPMLQAKELTLLAEKIKSIGLNIWLYTGFIYESVKDNEIMKYIDVVVDGKFDESLKILGDFKGSSNQRIIKLDGK